jgi:hypothetical protein
MNNEKEKQHLPETHPITSERDIKRCYRCNGGFGLVRYRFALKAFCSKRCLNEYRGDAERRKSRIKTWSDFLQKL